MSSLRERLTPDALLRAGAYGALAVVFVVFAVAAPGFLSFANLANVVQQSAILGLLAFGLTVVMIGGGGNVITGGIDLSLAANLGLSAAVYSTLIKSGHSDAIAFAATLGAGLAIGAVNALAVRPSDCAALRRSRSPRSRAASSSSSPRTRLSPPLRHS